MLAEVDLEPLAKEDWIVLLVNVQFLNACCRCSRNNSPDLGIGRGSHQVIWQIIGSDFSHTAAPHPAIQGV